MLLVAPRVHAQQTATDPAAIQGIVAAEATGQPLEGALVSLETAGSQVYGALTDREGLYQIGGIAPGEYVLRVRYIGSLEHEELVMLESGARATISVRLATDPVVLEGVVVDAPPGAALRELQRQQITPEAIGMVPTPAAAGDLATYLQILPGVVSLGDRGGQLFVRGGTHTENLSLVDGLLIYQPFHILGFFSAFPEDLISSVDYYAGGFGARYNGRTSSVMDVRMRDGDLNRFSGSGSVSPFVADVLVEGPLTPGRNSIILSAKRSLVEETSASMIGEEHPLSFESQFAKLSFLGDPNSRCSALGMRTRDEGRIDPEDPVSRLSWKNLVAGGRCVVLMDQSQRLIDVSAGYSSVRNEAVSRNSSSFFSNTTRLQADFNATQLYGGVRLDVGGFFRYETVEYDLAELFALQRASENVFTLGNYLEADFEFGDRLRVQPGLSITFAPVPGLEPRLRAGWQPFGMGRGELTAAAGVYRQALAGISDMRDASSVFVAWQRVPGDESMQAIHAILGWQGSVGDLDYSVEGYRKWLSRIPVPVWRTTAEFTTELVLADGSSQGIDTRLEYSRGPLYGFVGYGFGITEYEAAQDHFSIWFGEPVQRYNPPHDRRHQLNTILAVDFGPVRASGRWQLGTGLPVTRPLGFDEAFDFRFRIWNVSRIPGTTRVILDRPYSGRMPMMHRLDLSLEGSVDMRLGRLNLQAGVINAYDRANMFYYDLYTQRRIDQLPLAPYASIRFESR